MHEWRLDVRFQVERIVRLRAVTIFQVSITRSMYNTGKFSKWGAPRVVRLHPLSRNRRSFATFHFRETDGHQVTSLTHPDLRHSSNRKNEPAIPQGYRWLFIRNEAMIHRLRCDMCQRIKVFTPRPKAALQPIDIEGRTIYWEKTNSDRQPTSFSSGRLL